MSRLPRHQRKHPRTPLEPALQLQVPSDTNLKVQHRKSSRDVAPTGDELLSRLDGASTPSIPESWDIRPGAEVLNVSVLPEGPEAVKTALAAYVKANVPPRLFQRYGRLARVVPDERGLPAIVDVPSSALRGELMRTIDWRREARVANNEVQLVRIQPPRYIVSDIESHGEWPLPALKGISSVPVLRTNGSLCTSPGYDPASECWYHPGPELSTFRVPDRITAEDVQWAVALLRSWLCDFPFASEAERTSAIAFFLTLLARPAIRGNIPLALIEATKPRTGKTLLVESILLATFGQLPALTSVPSEEAEMRKLLASYALHGKPYLCFDNVSGRLDSPSLASVLTTGKIADRILKTNDAPDMDAEFVLVATGNQLVASTELLARAYRSNLDAQMSRPQDRTDFRHPTVLDWTRAHRLDLLRAGYILLRAFYQAGQPVPAELPRKGGFEEWTRIIGGTLANAGISGFLANERELAASADDDTGEMERFLAAWLKLYGHEAVKVGRLQKDAMNPHLPLSEALPHHLAEVTPYAQRFYSDAGKLLKRYRGTHFGAPDMWLEAEEDRHDGGMLWRVQGGDETLVKTAITVPASPLASNGHQHTEPNALRALLQQGSTMEVTDGRT